MIRTLLLPLALVTAPIAAQPAQAAEEVPVIFEQRAGFEMQSWDWGGTASYTAPMRVFTIIDHSGVLFGGLMAAAETESNRLSARNEAILKDERSYTYRVAEARRREGTRFGFSVGMGSLTGATTSIGGMTAPADGTANALQASLFLRGDLFPLLDGVFTFDTGLGYWRHEAAGATGSTSDFIFQAADWPIGLTYRYAPAFLPGLVIEPGYAINWLWGLGQGDWGYHSLGVEAGYFLHPRLKVRGGYHLRRLGNDLKAAGPAATMNSASAGLTAFF